MTDPEQQRTCSNVREGDSGLGEVHSGDWMGRYHLLRRLGEGGYGVVWMAEQREPVRRRVAIKFIKLGMDTRKVLARFDQERHTLARMDHPNIARIFDGGATPKGRPYFVMELVRGTKITEFCDREKLSMDERLELFLSVCSAVQHAHQKGIIHRDLKPSNILVAMQDGRPTAKVIDFGVAKAPSNEESGDLTCLTQFEQLVGTPLYMAPEQVDPHRFDIDTRCDIYALGVLLYELLAGLPPFDSKAMLQAGREVVRNWIREQEPPPPSVRLKSLDEKMRHLVALQRQTAPQRLFQSIRGDLDWIVMKAMDKARDRRYGTAKELADDVRRHLESEAVRARPRRRIYRIGRFAKRHRVPCVAVAMVFVTLLIGGIAVTREALEAQREATRASGALAALRENAPGLLYEARSVAARGDFDAALDKLSIAIRLVPDEPKYLVARGDLLQAQLHFADAAAAYRAALETAPNHPLAQANAKRSEALHKEGLRNGRPSYRRLADLLVAMDEEGRSVAERVSIARLVGEGSILRELLLEALENTWTLTGPDVAERVTLQGSGRLGVDLASTDITDLEVLQGFPIEALDLTATAIEDLSVLEGMPLRSLKLGNTDVEDLSPLQGLPLEILDASHIPVTDFTPLSRIPSLIELHLVGTEIANLEWLRSLGALKRLSLRRCRDVEDYAALAHLPALTHLRLPSGLVGVPDKVVETLEQIRNTKSLQWIASTSEAVEWDYDSAETFWARYDQIAVAHDVAKAFPGSAFTRRNDWTWIVIHQYRLVDLAPLKALPVSALSLQDTPISNLTPLNGLPLTWLELYQTDVKDLSPLRGLPLEAIFIVQSKHEIDMEPLASIPTLQSIRLPEKALNVESLLRLPRLDTATRRAIDDYLRLKENPTHPE